MKQLLISVILLFSISSSALCQIKNEYLGTYNVKSDAVPLADYLYENPALWRHYISEDYFQIIIEKISNDSVSIWDIGGYFVHSYVKVDSLFFKLTDYINLITISGKGKFFQDSINYSYFASGKNEPYYITVVGRKIITGQNEIKSNNLKYYPNPFKTSLTISLDIPISTNDASINLYSSDGLLVRKIPITQRGLSTITIDLADLKQGIYFGVTMYNNRSTSIFKIFKE